jgi:alpha-beta hydrolase superfamily lysophospholipase
VSRRIAFVLVVIAMLVPAAAAQAATPRKAPAGLAFYTPPAKLPARHGDLIWSRTIKGFPALPSAAKTVLVLYRSTSPLGKPVAVSGTVSIPKTKPPKGGWPMISWGHGTTGVSDVCTPSRDSATNLAHPYISYINPVLDAWVKKGYAVLRTDYQGLGTPGVHPFLIGAAEGRSVIDIARAARQLNAKIGKTWIAAGHSQGGHAVLFAGAEAANWAPELNLRGVAAYAPASHVKDQLHLAPGITAPGGGLSAFGALIAAGAVAGSNTISYDTLLTPAAKALLPQVDTKCVFQLGLSDSWGALAPADIVPSDYDYTALDKVLDESEPSRLKLNVPVLLLQGDADTTVYKMFTDQLDASLVANGTRVTYKVYPGVVHGAIPTAASKDADAFLAGRLKTPK